MGLKYFGVPEYLVIGLRNSLSLSSFVETGTNVGNTCFWAAQRFSHVISIEADERLYQVAQRRLGNSPNVDLRLGPSEVILRSVVPSLTGPALFWLDAHWCGEGTAGFDYQCPVLEEIGVVDSGSHQHVILIDDARMFLNRAPFRPEQWPNCGQLLDRLRERFSDAYIAIQDDVIVRVPARARAMMEMLLKAGSASLAGGLPQYRIVYSSGSKQRPS